MNKSLLSALFVASLTGCAASHDLPATYALDAKRQEGLVVASMTMSGKPLDKVSDYEYQIREVLPHGDSYAIVSQHYASARQHARSVQENGKDRPPTYAVVVKGVSNADELDIQDAGKAIGRLAVIRLSPGDYEIHTWQVREPSLFGETEYGPARELAYRFSIKPGEATYIGRLNLHLSQGNTERLAIEDRQAEDMNLLGRKYPGLRAAKITVSVGATSTVGPR